MHQPNQSHDASIDHISHSTTYQRNKDGHGQIGLQATRGVAVVDARMVQITGRLAQRISEVVLVESHPVQARRGYRIDHSHSVNRTSPLSK